MVDKVKPLKIENPALGGTQTDLFPTESNPSQDYLAAKGFSFENTDDKLFDLSPSGEIQYRDSIQTTYKKLNDITGGSSADNFSYHKIDADVSVTVPIYQHMITTSIELDGFLQLDGGLVFL